LKEAACIIFKAFEDSTLIIFNFTHCSL